MIIDDTHKFVFVAVPKNASTAIYDAFERSLGRRIPHEPERKFHATAAELSDELGARWTQYLRIGFVRNPYERFASSYWDFRFGRPRARSIDASFEAFCHSFIGSRWEGLRHFRPQVEFLMDEKGAILVDYLGRYENLDDDWNALDERLPFRVKRLRQLRFQTRMPYRDEWRNANVKRRIERLIGLIRWRIWPPKRPPLDLMYQSSRARQLVCEYYASDFECFGYPATL